MKSLNDRRLSKSMKYTALYWAMRFYETKLNIFVKTYVDGTKILINSNNQSVFINDKKSFMLNTHDSFVKLEFINRWLQNKKLEDLFIGTNYVIDRKTRIYFKAWDEPFSNTRVEYKSRLVSGIIEYKTNRDKKKNFIHSSRDFIIDGRSLIKYLGTNTKVVVPEGIQFLGPCAFWDNQSITEVVLPDSLISLGGDTFYNCKNLKKVIIPRNVSSVGNNPFAGCPRLCLKNKSKFFVYDNGVLYDNKMSTLIYCSIRKKSDKLSIPNTVEIIAKHAFYLCNKLKTIILPSSLKKIENNPFSGCNNLRIINNSKNLFIKDGVIYNKYKTSVLGVLNNTKSPCLKLLPSTETINRNSFWNCKGIKKIILPKKIVDIGYNPFVGCNNIHFVSLTPYYKVINHVLYNKDMTKIICYPSWKAIGEINLPDSVTTLERGAFSGCSKMTNINLHNVNTINKSCFTNCTRLNNIYISDLVKYVGEWSFAYCKSLKRISISNNTIIDNDAFSNSPTKILIRHNPENLVIESENINTLKSMLESYEGKIDSILIDPPYNSNINYIGYKDSNYDNGYINFISARIKVAYKLLSNKGFLILNIDDGEFMRLLRLLSSIFGKDNVFTCKWKKKHPFFDKNRVVLNPKKIQTDYENIIVCKKTNNVKLNEIKQPYIKDGRILEKISPFPKIFDCFGTTSSAKDEIKKIFGQREYFSTPKPVKLIREFARATTNKHSIVLDFFAGSGTTGQAVWELNKEDNGKRTFILISNNESDICKNVTVKRLQIKKIKFIFLS